MWRTGLAFSPSRASRAAVSASSGIPSEPVAISVWLTPARRYIAWRVRTWRSSPEWELAISASSAGSRSNASIPPASIRATTPNGLTQLRRLATRSGSPSPRIRLPSTSTWTMSPRWTLSSTPPRTWRTRTGPGFRRAGRPCRAGAPGRSGNGAAGCRAAEGGGRARCRSIDGRHGSREDSATTPPGRVREPSSREPPLLRFRPDDPRRPAAAGSAHPGGRSCRCPPPCTSRPTRPSGTSWRSSATSTPSRRSSGRSCASCRGCSATRRWPTRGSGR